MKRMIRLMGLLAACLVFASLSIPVLAAPSANPQTTCYSSANVDLDQGIRLEEQSISQYSPMRNFITSDQSFILKVSLPLLLIMCGSAVLLSKWLKS